MNRNAIASTLIIVCSSILFNISCSKNDVSTSTTSSSDSTTTSTGSSSVGNIDSVYTTGTSEGNTDSSYDADDILSNSTFGSTVQITFGTTLTVVNPLAGNGVTITSSGNHVVITSTVSNVAYVVSGTTTNGSIKLYSSNKYKLELNNANITNTIGSAINIQSKKRGFITIIDGTTNTLTDASSYTDTIAGEDEKATIFSEGQIILTGNGTLTVNGNYKHALCSDDYIRISSGNIIATSKVKDAIHTNDAFIMDGGALQLVAADDGIQVDEGFVVINNGTISVTSVGKGIAASYDESDNTITPYVTINGGVINVTSSKDEGIESKSVLSINGGYITTQTYDDGLNAADALYINGGHLYVYSTNNDAIDSNGTLTVTGGTTVAVGSKNPEASFDCDARTFKITGGNIIGVAGSTSGPTTSVSTIASMVMGSGSASQIVHLESSDAKEVFTFKSPIAFTTLIYASSKLSKSGTYNLYTGGSVSSSKDFNGLYTSGTYSGGTLSKSFTTSSLLTQIGGSISRN